MGFLLILGLFVVIAVAIWAYSNHIGMLADQELEESLSRSQPRARVKAEIEQESPGGFGTFVTTRYEVPVSTNATASGTSLSKGESLPYTGESVVMERAGDDFRSTPVEEFVPSVMVDDILDGSETDA